jgi:hypothetical protein
MEFHVSSEVEARWPRTNRVQARIEDGPTHFFAQRFAALNTSGRLQQVGYYGVYTSLSLAVKAVVDKVRRGGGTPRPKTELNLQRGDSMIGYGSTDRDAQSRRHDAAAPLPCVRACSPKHESSPGTLPVSCMANDGRTASQSGCYRFAIALNCCSNPRTEMV